MTIFVFGVNLTLKGLVHPKMKISLCFTHPQSILGVYDCLLSDESNWSYIKNGPGPPSLQHGVSGCFLSTVQKTWNKACASIIKCPSHGSGGWIKASCSESMRFCKINIHISNVINTFFSLPLIVGFLHFFFFIKEEWLHYNYITKRLTSKSR